MKTWWIKMWHGVNISLSLLCFTNTDDQKQRLFALIIIYGVSVIQAVNEKHETRFISWRTSLQHTATSTFYLKQMINVIYLMMAAHWAISSDPQMHRSFSRFILSSGEENKNTSRLFSMSQPVNTAQRFYTEQSSVISGASRLLRDWWKIFSGAFWLVEGSVHQDGSKQSRVRTLTALCTASNVARAGKMNHNKDFYFI